ncbi:MAG: hypothetical protein ACODAE_07545 [Gemmatimonadota bacterium]
MGRKDRGKGGARRGERRPRGPKRAPGGRRKGRLSGRGAEVWEAESGRRRGIGHRPEERVDDVRGSTGKAQEGEPDVDEIVERERGPDRRRREEREAERAGLVPRDEVERAVLERAREETDGATAEFDDGGGDAGEVARERDDARER